MSTYTIYHNPRCKKSREALAVLEEKKASIDVANYINDPLTFDQLSAVLDVLDINADDLIRKTESVWKETFADKELSEEELIYAMIEYPQLMQRPIVVKGDNAVIARPASEIDLLDK